MLDAAGFPDAVISASNDLDEYLIDSLKIQGCNNHVLGRRHQSDHLAKTARPSAVFISSLRSRMQRPVNLSPRSSFLRIPKKSRIPGNKTIYRIYDKETGKIKADLICLVDETYDENEPLVLFDPNEPWKKTKLLPGTYELRELMVHVFDHGNCIYHSPKVMDIRDYCQKELETLWEETRRLVNPHGVYVDLSQKLYDMKISLLNQMSQV